MRLVAGISSRRAWVASAKYRPTAYQANCERMSGAEKRATGELYAKR